MQIFSYDKLGILLARKTLRQRFLESGYDYMIMADNDMVMEGDPKELIEGMEQHPNGFAYVEKEDGIAKDAQLNLLAISKFIYAQQPMVNIDPQKDEGFEDNVFAHLLHYKWAKYQWHFKGITHIQWKNPNLEDAPPSTWSKEKIFNLKQMRTNTAKYRKEIEKGNYDIIPVDVERWEFPVDFVLPFVDCTDKKWQISYKSYCYYHNLANKMKSIDGARFTSFGIINYTIRCINKFMPWIRKIHLIVSNIEQVPKDLDMSKVNVVLHQDIMPAKILPTFNSSTIEMFIGNIKGLAEHFVYGNDDIMPVKYLTIQDFFTSDGLPKLDLKIVPRSRTAGMFDRMCAKQYYEVASHFKAKIDPETYVRPDHGLSALRRSTCLAAYQTFKNSIEQHLEAFRNEFQHQQYLYSLYEFFRGTCAISNIPFKYLATSDNIIEVRNYIASGDYAVICYNDVAVPDRSVLPEKMVKFKEAIEYVLNKNN